MKDPYIGKKFSVSETCETYQIIGKTISGDYRLKRIKPFEIFTVWGMDYLIIQLIQSKITVINEEPMETMEIIIPDGYEIDHDNSNNYTIKFKKIEKPVDPIELLPNCWADLCYIDGAYIGTDCRVYKSNKVNTLSDRRDILPTIELAEAVLALCQLLQLRDRWNGDWKADETESFARCSIVNRRGEVKKNIFTEINSPITLATEKLCDKFLVTFKDLLETAKPLL